MFLKIDLDNENNSRENYAFKGEEKWRKKPELSRYNDIVWGGATENKYKEVSSHY